VVDRESQFLSQPRGWLRTSVAAGPVGGWKVNQFSISRSVTCGMFCGSSASDCIESLVRSHEKPALKRLPFSRRPGPRYSEPMVGLAWRLELMIVSIGSDFEQNTSARLRSLKVETTIRALPAHSSHFRLRCFVVSGLPRFTALVAPTGFYDAPCYEPADKPEIERIHRTQASGMRCPTSISLSFSSSSWRRGRADHQCRVRAPDGRDLLHG